MKLGFTISFLRHRSQQKSGIMEVLQTPPPQKNKDKLHFVHERRTINSENCSNFLLGEVKDKIRARGKEEEIGFPSFKIIIGVTLPEKTWKHQEAKVGPPSPPPYNPK